MTQISYAQNFEDVLLHRGLSDVSSGFYIDVGANDPKFHSVTKRFYDLGWRGINIEPSREYFEKLNQERPRDLNIRAVVSNRDGLARFFEIEGTGISTTEQDIAQSHQVGGYASAEIEVEALTLATICRRYVEEPVHFLKIDVEGGTKSVLEGLDLQSIRPWIIVIEATKPLTQIEDSDEWEHLILSQNYEFVYADGLNKFYLAFEHSARREKFKYPPNIFDDFILVSMQEEVTLRQVSEAAALRAIERVATLEQDGERLAEAVRAQNAWGEVAEAKIVELSRDKAECEAVLAHQVALAQGAEGRIGVLEQDKIALAAAVQAQDAWGRAAEARIALLEQEKAGLEAALGSRLAQAQAAEARADGLERETIALTQALAAQDARVATAGVQLEQERAALQSSLAACAQAVAASAQLEREKGGLEVSLARAGERLQAALQRVVELEKLRHDLQVNLAEQTERARANGERAEHLEAMLRRVASSLSWRITAPLRGWRKGGGTRPSGS